jgi:hypothetical protein
VTVKIYCGQSCRPESEFPDPGFGAVRQVNYKREIMAGAGLGAGDPPPKRSIFREPSWGEDISSSMRKDRK